MTAIILLLAMGVHDPELPSGWSLGVYAEDADTGCEIVNINGTTPFRPASTVKALTALAALEYLGPEFIYRTSILADTSSGILCLVGSGAPLLSAEDVTRTAMETAAALPPGSRWSLTVDPGAITGETHLPGWDEDDWDMTYCPPIEPLCIGDNVLETVVSAVGGELRVFTYPPLPSLSIDQRGLYVGTATGITSSGGDWETGSPLLTLSGTIASGTSKILYEPFAGAPVEIALYLRQELEEYGLEVSWEGTGSSSNEGPWITTSVMFSDPLWVILGTMNKWSRNMVAEQVLRTIAGRVTGEPGSTRAGCDVSGALLDSLCPGVEGWQLADGSGLSRLNMLAPVHLARVFRHGAASLEYGPEFLAGFPVNGTDGTLSERLTGIPAGAFRGKTGSLNDTCTIAGILECESGRRIAVAVFLHIPRGHIYRARAWQDRYLEELYLEL